MAFNWGNAGQYGLLGGLLGGNDNPYESAMDEYQKWANQANQQQQPFYNAGVGAIGQYQDWLKGMKDPSAFMNNLMGQYQESPYAQYMKRQAQNAGINAASASGLMGSTPFMQQMQENAQNISNKDLNSWLNNVLGINQQYGQGIGNLMAGGQGAANALTQMFGNMAGSLGQAQMQRTMYDNQNGPSAMLGGLSSLLGSFL